jgi:hypothetical protein
MSSRWEYLTVELKPSLWGTLKAEALQEELNRQGRLGWELVNVIVPMQGMASVLVFKREQG